MAFQKRMSLWRAVHMAAFQVLACIIVVIARVGYVYGPKFWQSTTAVNFIAAWIPALIGVVVAFVPDKDLERHIRLRWRFTVAACFVGWSVVLWHQQTLTEASDKAEREELVAAAVGRSNDHADSKFHDVQQDVGKVHDEIGDVRQHVDTTEKELTSKLDQATSVISANIGRVGKPDPPELAKLRFTLFRSDLLVEQEPLMEDTVQQNPDGTIPISFLVRNASNVAAEAIDIWVEICTTCEYAKEPAGFDKPNGIQKQTRHMSIGELNSGVGNQVNVVEVRNSGPAQRIGIAFSYSCKNCGPLQRTRDYVIDILPATSSQP